MHGGGFEFWEYECGMTVYDFHGGWHAQVRVRATDIADTILR